MHVVWIHGFPLDSRIWSKQLSIAGAEHIAPDLPGFGNAPAPNRPYSMNDYASDVLRLLDERKIDRAVFAGLSMGGYILLALARLAPQRMAGVILADTRETPDTPDAKKGRYETIEKVKREGVRVVAESMLPKMLTAHAPKAMAEEVKQIMLSSSPHGVVAALTAMAERPDSSATLRRIDVPALVMAGDADAITPPSDAARMAEALPRATPVTIRGAAHLANYEQPQQFNDAVSSFLRRL